jgi:hypothetical protein
MVENLGRIWRSRRKELERERGRILSHNIPDVHASKSIFVPAATFGQLTKHIFDHGGGSHPNSNSLCQHGIQHILIFRQKRKAGLLFVLRCSSGKPDHRRTSRREAVRQIDELFAGYNLL